MTKDLEDLGYEKSEGTDCYGYTITEKNENSYYDPSNDIFYGPLEKTIHIFKKDFRVKIYSLYQPNQPDPECIITMFDENEIIAIINTIKKLKKEDHK